MTENGIFLNKKERMDMGFHARKRDESGKNGMGSQDEQNDNLF